MPGSHRYAHLEDERRFLLASVPAGLVGGRLVTDRYLPGTGLRLRLVREADGTHTHKLGHKVRDGFGPQRVWHTSLYLDEAEWATLGALGGQVLHKARYAVPAGSVQVAVDVFGGEHTGLVLAEVDLAAGAGEVPDDLVAALTAAGLNVGREVTEEEAYTGGTLAAVVRAETAAVVYWRSGCGDCLRLREALDGQDQVRWIDIRQDEAAAAFVRAANGGAETLPTVVVGAEVLTDPTTGAVRARLGQ